MFKKNLKNLQIYIIYIMQIKLTNIYFSYNMTYFDP